MYLDKVFSSLLSKQLHEYRHTSRDMDHVLLSVVLSAH